MASGLLDVPWWGMLAYVLIATHITIATVTIFLHRFHAHRALELHPAVQHFFRFWLWITTGIVTQQWVAVHRKHHAAVETPEDPHSPQQNGIGTVLFKGTELYRVGIKNQATLDKYGHGCPDDWMERNVYTPHSGKGYYLVMAANIAIFGPIGLTIWAIQMMWIPFLAAGVINGAGHYWGYRNFETTDASTNIVPWGILIGGEELHNNHHAFASSAKFSSKRWELDIGWYYIRALETVGLARVKKVPPELIVVPGKASPDLDTLSAVIATRFQVMSEYAKRVLAQVHKEELQRTAGSERNLIKSAKSLLIREDSQLTDECRKRLETALESSQALDTVYQYKLKLQAIWKESSASHERLLHSLQEWCRMAEESGVRALEEFAQTLPGYSLRTMPNTA